MGSSKRVDVEAEPRIGASCARSNRASPAVLLFGSRIWEFPVLGSSSIT